MQTSYMNYVKGSVWWAYLDAYESSSVQRGARPVVIVSSLICAQSSSILMVCPLTTKKKTHCTNVDLEFEADPGVESQAICSQVISIPKSKLTSYIGCVTLNDMDNIDRAVASALDLTLSSKNSEVRNQSMLDSYISDARSLIKRLEMFLGKYEKSEKAVLKQRRSKYALSKEQEESFIKEFNDSKDRSNTAIKYGFKNYMAAYVYWRYRVDPEYRNKQRRKGASYANVKK